MKLKNYRDDYYDFSRKASDVSRQLSFAGIALIWIFRFGNETLLSIPQNLLWPLSLLAAALACDLLQYVSGTLIWWQFYRSREKRGVKDDDELDSHFMRPWLMRGFVVLKIIFVIAAYTMIFKYMYILLKTS